MKKRYMIINILCIFLFLFTLNGQTACANNFPNNEEPEEVFLNHFLDIQSEKTHLFHTENFNVTITKQAPRLHPMLHLRRFYIYIVFEPDSPSNIVSNSIYSKIIGHSGMLTYSDLNENISIN
jgi:hypothetical protein